MKNHLDLICYRCGGGEFPENTFEAIENSLQQFPNAIIELDLQITKDNKVVVFHDLEVERTTNGKGKVMDFTFAELRRLNAGYHFESNGNFPFRNQKITIPTIKEVFEKYPNQQFLLDVHQLNEVLIQAVINIVERFKMEKNITIISTEEVVIQTFRKQKPNWKYGASPKEAKKLVYSSKLFLNQFISIKSDLIMLPEQHGHLQILSDRILQDVQKRGKKLWVT